MQHSLYAVLATSLIFGIQFGNGTQATGQEGKLDKVQAPMLWEISKGDSKSYLFGTIHITDSRCTTLHPLVQTAFDESEAVYVETDPRDSQKQLAAISMKDKKPADVLPEELLKRIDKQLADIIPNLTHQALPPLKTFAWAMVIPNLEAQMRNPTAQILDMKLVAMAQDSDKEVAGLENPAEQLTGMDQLSDQEQLDFLKDSLRSMEEADESDENPEAELAELYLSGDIEKMANFFVDEMTEGELSEELVEKIMGGMLYQRNERMAKKITELTSENPETVYFFAAGTAHYIGEKTVQDYLKEEGFEIHRVSADALESVR